MLPSSYLESVKPFLTREHLSFFFGLLASAVSFMVFLSPVPTFCTIIRKKTSEGFQSIPYVVALMSTMLLIYYGLVRTNSYVVIGINSVGFLLELIYITIYLIYAPKKEKMITIRLLLLLNIGAYGLVMLATTFLVKGHNRVKLIGTVCAGFNLMEFVAPLAIMRRVIKTKSVKYMPFTLSFTLTICAIMWFLYGFLRQDFFIAVPNVVGLTFGVAQMILYTIYKNSETEVKAVPEHHDDDTDTEMTSLKGRKTQNGNNGDDQHVDTSSEHQHINPNENNV